MRDPELPLSVVIPTRDRPERLAETLLALAGETDAGAFEVIVIDDGSAAPSSNLAGVLPPLPYALRFARQEPKGPAAARNLGIGLASGRRILLLGDDTRPAPGCLGRHLAAGGGSDTPGADRAVQGFIDWDPTREITPLMAFLAPAGPQFYFAGLRDGQPISFRAVLGSNFSAPRSFFLAEPFDETFAAAAVEDTELAWRWQRRHFPMVFCAGAVAWHHHPYSEIASFLARQERAGRAARHAVALHPSLYWPLFLEPRLFTAWLRLRRLWRRVRPTDGWDLACRKAYFRGYREARKAASSR